MDTPKLNSLLRVLSKILWSTLFLWKSILKPERGHTI